MFVKVLTGCGKEGEGVRSVGATVWQSVCDELEVMRKSVGLLGSESEGGNGSEGDLHAS